MGADVNADATRNMIAFFLITAFVGMLPALIIWAIPDKNKDIITYMVGQLSGMATMALGFYFTNKAGQDTLDAKRAETTGKMADAVVAATTLAPASDSAAKGADEVADAAANKADQIRGDAR